MVKIAAVLHNIRSAHNVGSIFRTSDGAGVSLVVLVGYTPRPTDQFGRVQKDIAKTALGAEHTIPWVYYPTVSAAVQALKADGWHITGVEQDQRSSVYRDVLPCDRNTAFVLGNEVRGLSPAARALCDDLVMVPMHGKKESLNVSVAAGIVLFAAVLG